MILAEQHKQLLQAVGGKEETLQNIHNAIMANGVSEKTFAICFFLLYHELQPEDNRVVYAVADKEWRRGAKAFSDAKLFAAINNVCDIVREYIVYSWNCCVLSSWIGDKELRRTEKELDVMESMPRLKVILKEAVLMMSSGERNAIVEWADEDGGGDDE